MITIFFAVQSAITPSVVPRTLESETIDGYELSCTIADSAWKTYETKMLQKGGRAFIAPGDDGVPIIFQTAIYSRVTTDGTGKLAGMGRFEKLFDKPGYGYATNAVEMSSAKGRATIKLTEISAQQFAVTVVQTDGSDRNPYAGFCNVKVIPQSPLTQSEIDVYVRDPWRIP
jgi:hypothetical protein